MPSRLRPRLLIFCWIFSNSPRRVMSTTFRLRSISLARRMRSSSPSGKTICCLALLARSMSSYSNITGVTRVERTNSMRPSSSEIFTWDSNNPRADAILRSFSGVSPALTELALMAVV